MDGKTPRHHSDKWHRCWADVQALGHDEHAAAAICTAALGAESYDAADPLEPAGLDDPAVLVDALEAGVKRALAPLVTRLGALEAATAALGKVQETVAALAGAAPVPGPPGPPGPPGADGLGVDDLRVESDGERTITLAWTRDGRRAAQAITLPVLLYRGVHVAGKAYAPGDVVTWGGSLWHANADTTARPGDVAGASAWTLAVKHGRDAR